MSLESVSTTYINGLVITNPTGEDDRSTVDDHLRLIKSMLKLSFPNLTGAVNVGQAALNCMMGATEDVQPLLSQFSLSGSNIGSRVSAVNTAGAAADLDIARLSLSVVDMRSTIDAVKSPGYYGVGTYAFTAPAKGATVTVTTNSVLCFGIKLQSAGSSSFSIVVNGTSWGVVRAGSYSNANVQRVVTIPLPGGSWYKWDGSCSLTTFMKASL